MIQAALAKPYLLDYDWLKANHTMIHYFGLGFIQVKLNDSERVHFYLPDLERTVTDEEIHNHRYDFSSTVLKGSLTQQFFTVTPHFEGRYVMTQVNCAPGGFPGPDSRCTPAMTSIHTYKEGGVYFITCDVFHRVSRETRFCITHISRGKHLKALADVVRPLGAAVICPFSKPIPEEELWLRIKEVL